MWRTICDTAAFWVGGQGGTKGSCKVGEDIQVGEVVQDEGGSFGERRIVHVDSGRRNGDTLGRSDRRCTPKPFQRCCPTGGDETRTYHITHRAAGHAAGEGTRCGSDSSSDPCTRTRGGGIGGPVDSIAFHGTRSPINELGSIPVRVTRRVRTGEVRQDGSRERQGGRRVRR